MQRFDRENRLVDQIRCRFAQSWHSRQLSLFCVAIFLANLALLENQFLLSSTSVGEVNRSIGSWRLVVVWGRITDNMIVAHQKVDEYQKDSLTKTMVGLLLGSFV